MKHGFEKLAAVLLAVLMTAGCGAQTVQTAQPAEIAAQAVPMAAKTSGPAKAVPVAASAAPLSITPEASGKLTQKTDNAVIDYSNTADGYIMARYTGSTTAKLKAQVTGPSGVVYTYDLTAGKWAVFSL